MKTENGIMPYQLISKWRSEIMGVAILWVVFFHSSVAVDLQPFSFIKDVGYGGVDIFVFVSGMGIWQSLSKNSVSTFFKNRLNRIVPTWWTYLLVCLVIGYLHTRFTMTFREVIGFATLTGFWLDLPNHANWYPYAIMLFYAISPVLYSLIHDSDKRIKTGCIMIAAALIMSLAGWVSQLLVAMSRLPIFILGMLFSATAQSLTIERKKLIIPVASFLVGTVLLALLFFSYPLDWLTVGTGLAWYPFFLIAPPITLFLAMLFNSSAKHARWLNALMRPLGKASLEVLLATDYILHWTDAYVDYGLVSAIIAFIAVFVGLFYHFVIEKIKAAFVSFLKKKKQLA